MERREHQERGTDPPVTENPALNPTRPWQGDDDTVFELLLLVKAPPTERADLLRRIADGEPHVLSPEEEMLAAFWNQMAQARGFVPMLTVDRQVCSLVPEICEPLRKALVMLDHQKAKLMARLGSAWPHSDTRFEGRHGSDGRST